jgi:KamA family protein
MPVPRSAPQLPYDEIGLPSSQAPPFGIETFSYRTNDYYASLIDWDDPEDPVRRLIVPNEVERSGFGSLDVSNEAANTLAPGLQHKYSDTALLLVTDQCEGHCRYCFRKRLVVEHGDEVRHDCGEGLEYIAAHAEISDVLLTGGDPLTLPTGQLRKIVDAVLAMGHVRTIRIGSKMPAFRPQRIIDDPELAALVHAVVRRGRSLYVMAHFDHPRELTMEAVQALYVLRAAGAMCMNQCPITKDINDDVRVLAELFQACTDVGCPQYYVFQCRPTLGNAAFMVPLIRAMEIVHGAQREVSGLSRRARFCLSHETGKIEMLGADTQHIYARYHRAKHREDAGRFLVYRRDDEACWLDDLEPVMQPSTIQMG